MRKKLIITIILSILLSIIALAGNELTPREIVEMAYSHLIAEDGSLYEVSPYGHMGEYYAYQVNTGLLFNTYFRPVCLDFISGDYISADDYKVEFKSNVKIIVNGSEVTDAVIRGSAIICVKDSYCYVKSFLMECPKCAGRYDTKYCEICNGKGKIYVYVNLI